MQNSTIDIVFDPVSVKRGRKFRGDAYDISAALHRGLYNNLTMKLWDPINKSYVWVNPAYVEQRTADPAQIEAEKKAYVEWVIDSTLEYCRRQSNRPDDEDEIKRFARNVLRKQHPEFTTLIDEIFPDERDVVVEVKKTLEWAQSLTTQPGIVYNRWCDGGKPLSRKAILNRAWSACVTRGYVKLDGFDDAWKAAVEAAGLADI